MLLDERYCGHGGCSSLGVVCPFSSLLRGMCLSVPTATLPAATTVSVTRLGGY